MTEFARISFKFFRVVSKLHVEIFPTAPQQPFPEAGRGGPPSCTSLGVVYFPQLHRLVTRTGGSRPFFLGWGLTPWPMLQREAGVNPPHHSFPYMFNKSQALWRILLGGCSSTFGIFLQPSVSQPRHITNCIVRSFTTCTRMRRPWSAKKSDFIMK